MCGVGRVIVWLLLYFVEMVFEVLDGSDLIVLIGMKVFVVFFVYFGKVCSLVFDGCWMIMFVCLLENMIGVMEVFVDLIGVVELVELVGYELFEL